MYMFDSYSAGPTGLGVCSLLNTRMIYRFESSTTESVLDRILSWSWHRADVAMWRGRSDRPGQYRFDWRISVHGVDETVFLLQFASVAQFHAEPDYCEQGLSTVKLLG